MNHLVSNSRQSIQFSHTKSSILNFITPFLQSLNLETMLFLLKHCPVFALCPGPQLLHESWCSIPITHRIAAFPLATVIHQAPDVQCHLVMQRHFLHTWLHGPHQGLGLLTPQTLAADIQLFTLDIVQDGDQVTATDIQYSNIPWRPGRPGAPLGLRSGQHHPATYCTHSQAACGELGWQHRWLQADYW